MPRIRVLLLIGLGLVLTFIVVMQIADRPPAPEQQELGPAAAAPLGPEFRIGAARSAIRRQPRLCSTSFSARQFVAQVRAVASLTDPSGQRQVQGLPLFNADQVRLVVDDSTCAAVSRVLGGYIKSGAFPRQHRLPPFPLDRKSTRLNSSHVEISYAVFCLKKKNKFFACLVRFASS